MIKVKFPSNFGNYYTKHVRYIYNVLKLSGMCDIQMVPPQFVNPAVFLVVIDGKPVCFDMTDFDEIPDVNCTILKRTCMEQIHNLYPMGPFVVFDHSIPANLSELINFDTSAIVKKQKYYYNQRAQGNALERRGKMYSILKNARSLTTSQQEYWEDSLSAEYVPMLPGANLFVFDRSVGEVMYLGGNVMHPKIDVLFPYGKKLVAGEHYIEIAHDCSDVLEKMESGIDTGPAAQEFMQCIRPDNLVKWWMEVI